MNWSEPVHLYCERVGAGFWAEPVNALTNAAFLLAAAIAFVHWRRAGARDWPPLALIVVLVAIGFGSFGFHTLATRGAVYLGRISYALYLWHWPLLVFVGLYAQVLPSWYRIPVVVLAVLPAALSYRFVERPFRKRIWLPGRIQVFVASAAWHGAAIRGRRPVAGAWAAR